MSLTIRFAGVDRTTSIDGVSDLVVPDARSGANVGLDLSVMAWAGWTPAYGQTVEALEGSRVLYFGFVTGIALRRHDKLWYYDCQTTSARSRLDRPHVSKVYKGTDYADVVRADDPKWYDRMDEPAASAYTADAAGYGQYGVFYGAPTFGDTGAVVGGKSIAFNGSTWIQHYAPSTIPLYGTMSLELFFNPSSLAAKGTLLSKLSGAGEFELTVETNGSVTFSHGNGSAFGSYTVAPAGTFAVGTMTHLVLVRDDTAKKLYCYVNGAVVNAAGVAYSDALAYSVSDIQVGRSGAASQYIVGSLAEVAVYQAALSATRVAAHYAARNVEPGVSATDVALDLIATFAPAGYSAVVQAGLPRLPEITFDCSLSEAIDQLGDAIGAARYVDESLGIHIYVSADSGVETPDEVTAFNVTEFQRDEDWTQVITRQNVKANGSTLGVPLSNGDTVIVPTDVSKFTKPAGAVKVATAPAQVFSYTGVSDEIKRSTLSGSGNVFGNPVVATSLSAADVLAPPWSVGGWVLVNGSIYLRVIGTDIASVGGGSFLLLEGAYKLASITRSGTVGTLTTVDPHPIFSNSTGAIAINGSGTAPWGGSSYLNLRHTVGEADNVWHFDCPNDGSYVNISNAGFCYTAQDAFTTTIMRSGTLATIACPTAHFCKAGDWVRISGATGADADYNGVWPVAQAKSLFALSFIVPDTFPRRVTGVTASKFGRVPSTLTTGWALQTCAVLTGATVTAQAAPGLALHAFVVSNDLAAQAALAAAEGTDGIRLGEDIEDESLTAASAKTRGDAELLVRSTPEVRCSFLSKDPKIRAGMTVSVNVDLGYLASVLDAAPAGYWPLDETTGTSAADKTGHGLTATLVGSPTLGAAPGVGRGKAMTFNGSSQYGWVADDGRIDFADGSFTFETWLKLPAGSTNPGWIAGKGNPYLGTADAGWGLVPWWTSAAPADLEVWLSAGGGAYRYLVWHAAEHGLVRDAWTHLVLVVDRTANVAKLFVNGAPAPVPFKTFAAGLGSVNNAKQFRFGMVEGCGYFAGSLDEVALYSYALGADRIFNHYLMASGRPAPIIESHKVTRVTFSGWNAGPNAEIHRRVETSTKRFRPFDVYRQMLLRD